MLIGGFQRNSLVDFPGIVASAIFFAGCNFRCPYCHNPGLVLGKGEEIPLPDILAYLTKARKIIDGVCITGGEPTLYGAKLTELMTELHSLGLKIKLDTNGSRPELLKKFVEEKMVDYVALDLKTSFEKYASFSLEKDSSSKVEESFQILQNQSEIPYEFRTTLDPRVVTRDDLELLSVKMKPGSRWFWQQFKNEVCLRESQDVIPFPLQEIESWQKTLSSHQIKLR